MQNSAPLVSIIVISYNSTLYIAETLRSILSEAGKEVEVIICDDCSKDNTVVIAREWMNENSAKFASIKLEVGQVNRGTPANCNRGLKKAKGEFIKIIAADDVLLPNSIGKGVKLMQSTNADLLYSRMEYINSESIRIEPLRNEFPEFFFHLPNKSRVKVYARNAVFLNTPSWMIKKAFIEKVGNFDESYRLLEDTVIFLRFLAINPCLIYLDAPTVQYRIHGSVSRGNIGPLYKDIWRVAKEERTPYLNLWNPKDFLYILDDYMVSKFAPHNYKKFLFLLRLFNPAFYAKRILIYMPNNHFLLPIKKAIS